jgi:hypothetical protein
MNENDLMIAQMQQAKKILQQSTPELCECGSRYFKLVYVIRKVSKLLIGAPEDQYMPIPVYRCDDCGRPHKYLDFEEPNEDKINI